MPLGQTCPSPHRPTGLVRERMDAAKIAAIPALPVRPRRPGCGRPDGKRDRSTQLPVSQSLGNNKDEHGRGLALAVLTLHLYHASSAVG